MTDAISTITDSSGSAREGATESITLTSLARGPWQEDAAHGGAPAALVARAAERLGLADDLRLASLSLAFNGPVTLGKLEVRAEIVKPGRRHRVVRVVIQSGDRTLIEGRAVLLRRGEVDLPDQVTVKEEPFPGPGQGRPIEKALWADGESEAFHRTANTVVAIEGGPDRVGTEGMVWIRLDFPLVGGEELTGAQRAMAAADFGNGVAHPVGWGEFLFINCDLNVSLLREPVGQWIGLESRTEIDRNGSGLTSTRLHDRNGRFGVASQILFVDRV
ncbi:MAG: thioesterase family protein [Solirubrobacterales bacterium]|nr:thioesterase family protein [Solirubrobacterales bacterium]HMT04583.1 thioesterase family protein [Solirubrobacterales bacterium]